MFDVGSGPMSSRSLVIPKRSPEPDPNRNPKIYNTRLPCCPTGQPVYRPDQSCCSSARRGITTRYQYDNPHSDSNLNPAIVGSPGASRTQEEPADPAAVSNLQKFPNYIKKSCPFILTLTGELTISLFTGSCLHGDNAMLKLKQRIVTLPDRLNTAFVM